MRHGPQIQDYGRGGSAGNGTLEGRIYGDAPWSYETNFSYKWLDETIMNRTINDYFQNSWEQIRSDLTLKGVHKATFDVGYAVGEGFFNSGQMGVGPRQAVYHQTSQVKIIIQLIPGNPPSYFVVSAFPNGSGQK